ncbi:MAG TPA: DUF4870 domain-containing protein [Blastocatellia bacterium]|nr:DUF4870 domain-containing protein [Blastocatellia bacterium]
MGYQPPYGSQGGGYPPPQGGYGGGYPPPPQGPIGGKTRTLNLDYNIAGLLCYLPICAINLIASILWLVTEPRENRILRFHALQSLLLIGVFVVLMIVLQIFGVVLSASGSDALACIGGLFGFGGYLLTLGVFLVLSIIGMIKAYQGQMWKIPMIGDIADRNA